MRGKPPAAPEKSEKDPMFELEIGSEPGHSEAAEGEAPADGKEMAPEAAPDLEAFSDEELQAELDRRMKAGGPEGEPGAEAAPEEMY